MKRQNKNTNKKIIAKRVSALKGVEYLYSATDCRNQDTWINKDRIYNLDEIEDFEKNLLLERQKNCPVDNIDASKAGIVFMLEEARNRFTSKGVFDNEKFLPELNSLKKSAAATLGDSKVAESWVPVKVLEKTIDTSGLVYYNLLCRNGNDKWLRLDQLNEFTELIENFEHYIDTKSMNFSWLNSEKMPSAHPDLNRNISRSISPKSNELAQIRNKNAQLNSLSLSPNPVQPSSSFAGQQQTSLSGNRNNISIDPEKNQASVNHPNNSLATNIPQVSEPDWENFNIKLPNSTDSLEFSLNQNPKALKKKLIKTSIKQMEFEAKPLKPSRPSTSIPEPVTLRGNATDSIYTRNPVMNDLLRQHNSNSNKTPQSSNSYGNNKPNSSVSKLPGNNTYNKTQPSIITKSSKESLFLPSVSSQTVSKNSAGNLNQNKPLSWGSKSLILKGKEAERPGFKTTISEKHPISSPEAKGIGLNPQSKDKVKFRENPTKPQKATLSDSSKKTILAVGIDETKTNKMQTSNSSRDTQKSTSNSHDQNIDTNIITEELDVTTIFKNKIGFKDKVDSVLSEKERSDKVLKIDQVLQGGNALKNHSIITQNIKPPEEVIIDGMPVSLLQGQVKFNSKPSNTEPKNAFRSIKLTNSSATPSPVVSSKGSSNFDSTTSFKSQAGTNIKQKDEEKKDTPSFKKSVKPVVFIGSVTEAASLKLSRYSSIYAAELLPEDLLKSSGESEEELLMSGIIFNSNNKIKRSRVAGSEEKEIPDDRISKSKIYTTHISDSKRLLVSEITTQSLRQNPKPSSKFFRGQQKLNFDKKASVISSDEEEFVSFKSHNRRASNTLLNHTNTKKPNNHARRSLLANSKAKDDDSEFDANTALYDRIKSSRKSRRGRSFNGSRQSTRNTGKRVDYTPVSLDGAINKRSMLINNSSSFDVTPEESLSETDIIRTKKVSGVTFSSDSDILTGVSKTSAGSVPKKLSCTCEFCSIVGLEYTVGSTWESDSINRCVSCYLVSHGKCLENFLGNYKLSKFEAAPPVPEETLEQNIDEMKNSTSWFCIFCKTFKTKAKKVLAYRTIGSESIAEANSPSKIHSEINEPVNNIEKGSPLVSKTPNHLLPADHVSSSLTPSQLPKENNSNAEAAPNTETGPIVSSETGTEAKKAQKESSPAIPSLTPVPEKNINWSDKEFLVLLHGNSYKKLSWIPVFYFMLLSASRFKATVKSIYQDSPELRKILIPVTYTQVDFFLDSESCDGNEIFKRTQELRTIADKSAHGSISEQEYERMYVSIKRFYVKWKGLPVSDSTYDEPPHPYYDGDEYKIWLEKWNNFQQMRKVSACTAQNHINSFESSYFSQSTKARKAENDAYNARKNQISQVYTSKQKTDVEIVNIREKLKAKNLEELQRIDNLEKAERSRWIKDVFREVKEQPDYLNYGKLYPYQLEGINWLLYKWISKESCILADEMGLGKTVQIASFFSILMRLMSPNASAMKIKSIFAQNRLVFPFLVVVPNSLIDQWVRELNNWAPDMVALAYNGSKESKAIISNYLLYRKGSYDSPQSRDLQCHVVVTSYETMTRNEGIATLKKFSGEWQCLVVDEGHRLKNDRSKLFNNLNQLKCRHSVLLTGTPVQNHVREIINLMNFVQPKLFSDVVSLEKEFENASEEKLGELRSRMQPHFLRRWRDEALKELLPAKHEIIVPVSLTAWQRELYKAILKKNVKALNLIQKIFEKSSANSSKPARSMSLNNVLVQVRKVIDHPYIYEYNIPEFKTIEEAQNHLVQASGKMQLLTLIVCELIKRGRRLLIFAQFKEMLNNLEDYFYRENIGCLRIDGDTLQAERLYYVDLFNNNPDKYFVFIASTRAGGVGLNLHTADTVVIYSPDWNPQIDMQALSRAYRIGQKKPVLVLRLMTRSSAEERIMQVAAKKILMDHILIEKMNSVDEDEVAATDKDLASTITCGAQELFEEQSESTVSIAYDEAKVKSLLDECEKVLKEKDEIKRNPAKTGENQESDLKKGLFAHARIWDVDQNIENDLGNSSDEVNTDLDWINKIKTELEVQNQEDEQLGRGFRRKNQVVYFGSGNKDIIDLNTKDVAVSNLDFVNTEDTTKLDHSSDSDFVPDSNLIANNTSFQSNSNPQKRIKSVNTPTFKVNLIPDIRGQYKASNPQYTQNSSANIQPQNQAGDVNAQSSNFRSSFINAQVLLVAKNPRIREMIESNAEGVGKHLIMQALEYGKNENLQAHLQSATAKSYLDDLHCVVNNVINISSGLDETFLAASFRLSYILNICCKEANRLGPKTSDSQFLTNALEFVKRHSINTMNQNRQQPIVPYLVPNPITATANPVANAVNPAVTTIQPGVSNIQPTIATINPTLSTTINASANRAHPSLSNIQNQQYNYTTPYLSPPYQYPQPVLANASINGDVVNTNQVPQSGADTGGQLVQHNPGAVPKESSVSNTMAKNIDNQGPITLINMSSTNAGAPQKTFIAQRGTINSTINSAETNPRLNPSPTICNPLPESQKLYGSLYDKLSEPRSDPTHSISMNATTSSSSPANHITPGSVQMRSAHSSNEASTSLKRKLDGLDHNPSNPKIFKISGAEEINPGGTPVIKSIETNIIENTNATNVAVSNLNQGVDAPSNFINITSSDNSAASSSTTTPTMSPEVDNIHSPIKNPLKSAQVSQETDIMNTIDNTQNNGVAQNQGNIENHPAGLELGHDRNAESKSVDASSTNALYKTQPPSEYSTLSIDQSYSTNIRTDNPMDPNSASNILHEVSNTSNQRSLNGIIETQLRTSSIPDYHLGRGPTLQNTVNKIPSGQSLSVTSQLQPGSNPSNQLNTYPDPQVTHDGSSNEHQNPTTTSQNDNSMSTSANNSNNTTNEIGLPKEKRKYSNLELSYINIIKNIKIHHPTLLISKDPQVIEFVKKQIENVLVLLSDLKRDVNPASIEKCTTGVIKIILVICTRLLPTDVTKLGNPLDFFSQLEDHNQTNSAIREGLLTKEKNCLIHPSTSHDKSFCPCILVPHMFFFTGFLSSIPKIETVPLYTHFKKWYLHQQILFKYREITTGATSKSTSLKTSQNNGSAHLSEPLHVQLGNQTGQAAQPTLLDRISRTRNNTEPSPRIVDQSNNVPHFANSEDLNKNVLSAPGEFPVDQSRNLNEMNFSQEFQGDPQAKPNQNVPSFSIQGQPVIFRRPQFIPSTAHSIKNQPHIQQPQQPQHLQQPQQPQQMQQMQQMQKLQQVQKMQKLQQMQQMQKLQQIQQMQQVQQISQISPNASLNLSDFIEHTNLAHATNQHIQSMMANQALLKQQNNLNSQQNISQRINNIGSNNKTIHDINANNEALQRRIDAYNKLNSVVSNENTQSRAPSFNLGKQSQGNIQESIQESIQKELQSLMKEQIQQQFSIIQEQLQSQFEAKLVSELEIKVQEQLRAQLRNPSTSKILSTSSPLVQNPENVNAPSFSDLHLRYTRSNTRSSPSPSSLSEKHDYRHNGFNQNLNNSTVNYSQTSSSNHHLSTGPITGTLPYYGFKSSNELPGNQNNGMESSNTNTTDNGNPYLHQQLPRGVDTISNNSRNSSLELPSVVYKDVTLMSLINNCPLCGLAEPPHVANDCPYKSNIAELILRRDAIKNHNEFPDNLKEMVITTIDKYIK